MDSCSPSSPTPRSVAERTKSSRASHSSLLLHSGAVVVSSKSRKALACALKPSGRPHPPTSRVPAPPHIEKMPTNESVLILQDLSSSGTGEKSGAGHEALRREIAVGIDESSKRDRDPIADERSQGKKAGVDEDLLKEIEASAEDETAETEKVVAKDETAETEKVVAKDEAAVITEALISRVNQSDASLWRDLTGNENAKGHGCTEYNDFAEKEEKKSEIAEISAADESNKCQVATDTQGSGVPFDQMEEEAVNLVLDTEVTHTENCLTNLLKVCAQQDSRSPVADMETTIYDEQIQKPGQTAPGSLQRREVEIDKKQRGCRQSIFTEHLISEQERFLFIKGESIFKESSQSSEGLPAVECNTLENLKDKDVSSFSQPETAVIAASDSKPTHSSTALDVACNGRPSRPYSEDRGFIEAAMFALVKDVLANCPALEDVHCMSGQPTLSCPWRLSRRAFLIPSLVVSGLLCLLVFATAVIQDKSNYLYPT